MVCRYCCSLKIPAAYLRESSQNMMRPYAPTGTKSTEDDDDDNDACMRYVLRDGPLFYC